MSGATRTEIFKVPAEKFFQVIIDYEKYPDFVDGVEEIKVLKKTENGAQVKFTVNIIKKFEYILDLVHKKNEEVSWTFNSGDLFKENTGGWKLKDLGSKGIEVTYYIDAEFKIFAPKMIVDKLVSKNLPATMQAYFERAKKQK